MNINVTFREPQYDTNLCVDAVFHLCYNVRDLCRHHVFLISIIRTPQLRSRDVVWTLWHNCNTSLSFMHRLTITEFNH